MTDLEATYFFPRNNHLTERQKKKKQGKISFIRKLKRINHLKLKHNRLFNLILPCEMQGYKAEGELHSPQESKSSTHNIKKKEKKQGSYT